MAPNGLKWPKNDPKWLKMVKKLHFVAPCCHIFGQMSRFTRIVSHFSWNVAIYALCRILAEMSRFTRFARHKFSAARHLKLFCTPVCIPHMILKHQIISRFLQTERMLLEKVSPDTSLGSSQFTAWQSGLQVEAQKILACSIMLSRRRQQQRAVEGSSGCWTWRILSSVSTVFAKVLFSMIQL